MKKIIISSVITSIFITGAYAEKFEGPYVGIYGGISKAEDVGTGYDYGTNDKNGWTQKSNPGSKIFGVVAGYDWKVYDNFIVGIVADYERRSGTDSVYQKDDGVTDTDYEVESEINKAYSLRAKIGYIITDDFTIYGTIGKSRADVKRKYIEVGGDSQSDSDWQTGTTYGLGTNYTLSDNLVLQLEYRRTKYDLADINVDDLWGESYDQELDENTVRLGISYQF